MSVRSSGTTYKSTLMREPEILGMPTYTYASILGDSHPTNVNASVWGSRAPASAHAGVWEGLHTAPPFMRGDDVDPSLGARSAGVWEGLHTAPTFMRSDNVNPSLDARKEAAQKLRADASRLRLLADQFKTKAEMLKREADIKLADYNALLGVGREVKN